MSSSFFLRRDRPGEIREVLARLDPTLAWADGDLAALQGPWPEQALLLYLPGRSSRGVEVSHDGDRVVVRLLALSTEADYQLAFQLLEVLGGTALVEPEEGEPCPAGDVRARFGGEWMARDMAVGVTAVNAGLATGKTVKIEGPVNAVELEPGSDFGAVELVEIMRKAQVPATPPTTTPPSAPPAKPSLLSRLRRWWSAD